jgi:hypothetical protein
VNGDGGVNLTTCVFCGANALGLGLKSTTPITLNTSTLFGHRERERRPLRYHINKTIHCRKEKGSGNIRQTHNATACCDGKG